MKKLLEWIKSYAMTFALDHLKNNKDEIIAKLNKKVDVKFLNERQERDLLEAAYNVILEAFDDTEADNK